MRQRLPAAVAAVLLVALAATADLRAESPVAAAVRERVTELWSTGRLTVAGAPVASRDMLPELYERNGFEPLWGDPRNVRDLIAEVGRIDEDGLNPEDYHLSAIMLARLQMDESGGDPSAAADFDILLTDSLVRLVYHLLFGKLDPERMHPDWNMQRLVHDRDPVAALERRLKSATLAEGLRNIRPRYAFYGRLKEALKAYRAIQEAGGWAPVPSGPALRPGAVDRRVTALRRRLAATGDYSGPAAERDVFDGELEAAVRRFQARHRLAPDGVVGRDTLAALNVPVRRRIDQIRVNLERARWVLHKLPPDYLLVDIAGFEAHLYRGDTVVWSSRIQVGKPYRHTPAFKSKIKYLVFNPTWTVPPTILEKDILPRLRKDPAYLRQMHIEVFDRDGAPVDPDTVDWTRFRSGHLPYTFRQTPGPHNALGRIKFIFPNRHFIYLHDTPSRQLFEKPRRDFSSGCIRVERFIELTEILLDDPRQWGEAQIQALIDSGETRVVPLATPMPVILIYRTVTIGPAGEVIFQPDIYGRDPAVLEGLNEDYGIWQRRAFDGARAAATRF